MPLKKTGLQGTEAQAKIRTLLALWNLGGPKAEVKKSELTKRVQRTNEKAGDYHGVFEELEKEGALALATKNRSVKVSLTHKGIEVLNAGLKRTDFQFGGRQVRAKDVNALLKWIRYLDATVAAPVAEVKPPADAIASDKEFEQVVLQVYDELNWQHNFDNLVPIYHIRRQIGDRVSREQFNKWLLEMQTNYVLQLQGGSLPDTDLAKIEDSITTEPNGLRCYAKRLTP